MGSVWAASAPGLRHPTFEIGSEEAVSAWSGPQPYHPEAVPFVNNSLNHLFGRYSEGPLKGHLKPREFFHTDTQTPNLPLDTPAWACNEPHPQRPAQAAIIGIQRCCHLITGVTAESVNRNLVHTSNTHICRVTDS